MGNVATMVVKIDANITSLEKNLDKGQRAVLRAAEKVSKLGNTLTLGITAPVLFAAGAFSKMAADAEAASKRMDRVFGTSATGMQQFLTGITKQIPETMENLQQMSSEVKNLADNLGLAPAATVQMSKGLISLAGDLAAFNHEASIQPALDALEKGLAGKTRGLMAYGIAIKEADIQQEAFREGLLQSGQQLTATGTAIVTYNLMMQRSKTVQGEAARTAMDAQRQFAFLRRDLSEMGDQIGALVLPYVVALAKGLRDLLQWVSSLPNWVGQLTWGVLAFAATAGPILKLYSALVKLELLFAALKGATAISWLATLASPIGIAVVGFIALTAAIAGAYYLWKKFHGDADTASSKAKKGANDPQALAGLYGPLTRAAAGGSATDMATGSPLDQLQKHVSSVAEAFKYASDTGGSLTRVFSEADKLSGRILKMVRSTGDAFSENAQKLRAMLQQLREITTAQSLQGLGLADASLAQPIDTRQQGATRFVEAGALIQAQSQKAGALSEALDSAIQRGGDLSGIFAQIRDLNNQALDTLSQIPDNLSVAGVAAQSLVDKLRPLMKANGALGFPSIGAAQPSTFNAHGAAAIEYERSQKEYANSLALQQELLKLPDYFDATGEAAVRVGESLRNVKHESSLLGTQFQSLKAATANLRAGMGQAANDFAQQFSVSNVSGSLFSKLLTAIGGNASSVGGQVGGLIGSDLGSKKAIGGSIGKLLGDAAGPITQALSAAVGSAIGNVFSGIFGGNSEWSSIIKANTEAIKQDTLQRFSVNAANTSNAAVTVSKLLQDYKAVDAQTAARIQGLGLFANGGLFQQIVKQGEAQKSSDTVRILHDAGLSLDELNKVAQTYGITLEDQYGNIIPKALDQFTAHVRAAAEEAFKFQTTMEGLTQTNGVLDRILGKTGDQDALNRWVKTLQEGAPNLPGESSLSGLDLTAKTGQDALRAWMLSIFNKAKSGGIDLSEYGAFQNADEFLQFLGSGADALNALGNAANSVTESLTNMPNGFKIARDRFLATLPEAAPGTDVVGLPVPTLLGRSGLPNGNSSVPSISTNDTYNFTINLTTPSPDPKQTVDDLEAELQRRFNRGGTTRLSLLMRTR